MFEVTLRSVGNPDYNQRAAVSPKCLATATSLKELKEKVLAYIEYYQLGSGNWPTCLVKQDGEVIGRFSYNGRLWSEQGKEIEVRS